MSESAEFRPLRPVSRKLKALFVATSLVSATISLLAVVAAFTPIAVYRGYVADGAVSLVWSNIRVYDAPAVLRPLESLPRVSAPLIALSLASVILGARAAIGFLRARPRGLEDAFHWNLAYEYLRHVEALVLASATAVMSFTLLIALVRVVVSDILPAVPLGSCIETQAGRLCLNSTEVSFSWVYRIYFYRGILVIAVPTIILLPTAITALLTIRSLNRYLKYVQSIKENTSSLYTTDGAQALNQTG